MRKIAFLFGFFVCFSGSARAVSWSEADFYYGANEFSRTGLTFLSNISSRAVAGINASFYKREKSDKIYSFRLPFNYFTPSLLFSFKPFFYPKAPDGSYAYGGRLALSHIYQDNADEMSTSVSLAGSAEKQILSSYNKKTVSDSSMEAQVEENFYDQFFVLLNAGYMIKSQDSGTVQKRHSEISDMLSPNSFAFIDDVVYSVMGLQFARSMKPDFNSYAYAGADRLNCKISDYNSYVLGLRVNFSEKNFFNFSYNYLDSKTFRDKSYYKINVGVVF